MALSFGQTKSLGVVLPLVVRLCHRGGAEGGVTQLTVVILCGQDHPAPWLAGAHLGRDRDEGCGYRLRHAAHPGWRRAAVSCIIISQFLAMVFTLIVGLGLLSGVQGDIAEFAEEGLTQLLQGRIWLPSLS